MSISRPSEASRLGVLFVCEDNARRSLIAEALIRDRCASWVRGFSAGIRAADHADLRAMSTLGLAGLDNTGLWPKAWNGFCKTHQPIIDVIVMLDFNSDLSLPREFPGNPEYRTWTMSQIKGYSTQSHSHVWEEIKWLRPKVNALIDDLSAMREISLSRQPLAAE